MRKTIAVIDKMFVYILMLFQSQRSPQGKKYKDNPIQEFVKIGFWLLLIIVIEPIRETMPRS